MIKHKPIGSPMIHPLLTSTKSIIETQVDYSIWDLTRTSLWFRIGSITWNSINYSIRHTMIYLNYYKPNHSNILKSLQS